MKILTAAAALVIVAGLLLFELVQSPSLAPAPNRTAADGRDREIAALRAELTALRAEVRTMRAQPARVAVERDVGAQTDPSLEVDDRPPRDDASHPTPEQVLEGVDDRLASEPRDGSWAGDAERAFEGLLAEAGLDAYRLDDVECGSSACRLAVSYRTELEGEQLLGKLTFEPPFENTDVMAQSEPTDEGGRTVMYVSRNGFSLRDGQPLVD